MVQNEFITLFKNWITYLKMDSRPCSGNVHAQTLSTTNGTMSFKEALSEENTMHNVWAQNPKPQWNRGESHTVEIGWWRQQTPTLN